MRLCGITHNNNLAMKPKSHHWLQEMPRILHQSKTSGSLLGNIVLTHSKL
jgi:hypothetical protein